jgi:hypothetical protein
MKAARDVLLVGEHPRHLRSNQSLSFRVTRDNAVVPFPLYSTSGPRPAIIDAADRHFFPKPFPEITAIPRPSNHQRFLYRLALSL